MASPKGLVWDSEVDPFKSKHPCYSACMSSDELGIAYDRYDALKNDMEVSRGLHNSMRDIARLFFIQNKIGCGSWDA